MFKPRQTTEKKFTRTSRTSKFGKPTKFKRKFPPRQRNLVRFELPKDAKIEYKNVPLLQKFLNDRGKIVPRRVSGISSSEQRKLTEAIKRARFLALLTTGGAR